MNNPKPLHEGNDPVAILRDPATIRFRAKRLYDLGLKDELVHFEVDTLKLPAVADLVASVIRENYPDLKIPYHGRWRHFAAGGHNRWSEIAATFTDKSDMVRAAIDLAVVSVLLDAGAGSAWKYREEKTGLEIGRSEGLGIASFYMFKSGMFSSDPKNPLRADADALAALDEKKLAEGFQISDKNPMAGIDGRIALVKNLAKALKAHPELFGTSPARPGNLFNVLGQQNTVQAKGILAALLKGFATIWPGRVEINGENLGDVWHHSRLPEADETHNLMPLHKLSQWLTYSLLEPFEWAGKEVEGLDQLTGLAEYRNGGLFIDTGVLVLKNADDTQKSHKPSDEIIVEWRALTVALLDELRIPVAQRLGIDERDFPLAKLLEGGTWWAGRKLAFARTPSGDPPLKIESDGTVF